MSKVDELKTENNTLKVRIAMLEEQLNEQIFGYNDLFDTYFKTEEENDKLKLEIEDLNMRLKDNVAV